MISQLSKSVGPPPPEQSSLPIDPKSLSNTVDAVNEAFFLRQPIAAGVRRDTARWIAARRPIERGLFLVHGEEPAIAGLAGRVAERIIPAARIYQPLLDDAFELAAPEPRLLDGERRRRLAPEAVTHLDWHNDMSRLILDINDEVRSAADDRARGIIIRRLRRALENAN